MSRCNDENDIPNLIFIFALLTINEKKVFSLYHLKNETMRINLCLLLFLVLLNISCNSKRAGKKEDVEKDTYANPLFMEGANSSAIYHNGKYYYTHETNEQIYLWVTTDITDMAHSTCKEVWVPKDPSNSHNLWNPEIRNINGKWYIYFAADDGNTDNHQIYVIENDSPDPMQGEFRMKGAIMTNPDWNWGIHPSTFEHKGELYLLWSGWPNRRIGSETQCIYIARMENPWTLATERVLISKPEYEWERQWVNPDGGRSAYPIYVNESPQYFHSKDNRTVIVYYAASGCWSPYYCTGMLTADADSDLLNPASWKKSPVPVFQQRPEDGVYGPANLSFLPSPDGTEWYILYQARSVPSGNTGESESRNPRLQKIGWDADGMPDLGVPLPVNTPLPKPSGTVPNQ